MHFRAQKKTSSDFYLTRSTHNQAPSDAQKQINYLNFTLSVLDPGPLFSNYREASIEMQFFVLPFFVNQNGISEMEFNFFWSIKFSAGAGVVLCLWWNGRICCLRLLENEGIFILSLASNYNLFNGHFWLKVCLLKRAIEGSSGSDVISWR